MSSAVKVFHENVVKLITRTGEPHDPVNYRGRHYESDTKYVLLHEEERHLADDIAFLAQRLSGPNSISAVTVEQCLEPPSLIVRLAAN